MKKLLTYLLLIICIYANAQSAEDVKNKKDELSKYETNWQVNIENKLLQLTRKEQKLRQELNSAISRIEKQSEHITQLKIKSIVDSLKIDRLEKQINYTQSFVKDSVVFVVDSISEPEPLINLVGPLDNLGSAWSVNHDLSYKYNHNTANYSYIYFKLKETLKPNSTYTISFTIQLAEADREALINFWFYDKDSNQRLPGSYYSEGKHSFEYTVNSAEKIKLGIRARNNNGGSFDLIDLKVVEK